MSYVDHFLVLFFIFISDIKYNTKEVRFCVAATLRCGQQLSPIFRTKLYLTERSVGVYSIKNRKGVEHD